MKITSTTTITNVNGATLIMQPYSKLGVEGYRGVVLAKTTKEYKAATALSESGLRTILSRLAQQMNNEV